MKKKILIGSIGIAILLLIMAISSPVYAQENEKAEHTKVVTSMLTSIRERLEGDDDDPSTPQPTIFLFLNLLAWIIVPPLLIIVGIITKLAGVW